MSADTTTPPAAPLVLRPSPAVVNALLKWSAEDRRELAWLLLDSARDGFSSLEEAEQFQKDELRRRIDDVVSGRATLLDAEEVLADLERRFPAGDAT